MAKFCTNCGKALKDGIPCDCQKEVNKVNEISNNEMVVKLIDMFKGMFVKPVDTVKKYTHSENFGISMILVGILSVFTGLFTMALMKNSYELIASMMLGGMSSSYSMSSVVVDINSGGIFVGSAIATFVISFGYVGLLYLVNTIMFKGNASYKKIYSMYGVISIITTVSLAAATLLSFLNVGIALIIFVLGALLNLVYMICGLKLIGPKDENKIGYIYIITTVFYFIVLFVITKLFS